MTAAACPGAGAAGSGRAAGSSVFLAATRVNDADARAVLRGWFERRPLVMPVLVTVDPLARFGSPLLLTLHRSRDVLGIPFGAKFSNDRLFVRYQATGISVHDESYPQIVFKTAPRNLASSLMPRLPAAPDRLPRQTDVKDFGVTDKEVQTRPVGQRLTAINVRDRRQDQGTLQQRHRHHAPRHSVIARRSRCTIKLLRLRSSSLAHATSVACRSGDNRTKSPTAFSAMTPVYIRYLLATMIAYCYDSRVLLHEGRFSVTRFVAQPGAFAPFA